MLNKFFNQEALKPLNNPKQCQKLYVESADFYQYVYALKWNYIETDSLIEGFCKTQTLLDFIRAIYLLYSVEGAQVAYNFVKRNGYFSELTYNNAHHIELLVLLLRIYSEVGTADDIDFVLQLMKSSFAYTLPKTLAIPDIYTHASLHALIAKSLKKHGKQARLAHSDDVVLIDVQDGKLALSNMLGKELPINKNKTITIGAMMRVRNESENIGIVIESISNYVDTIIIYDDCSTDDTVEVVKGYQAQGYQIKLIEGEEWLFNESLIHQIIVAKGRTLGVTHFVQLDADEVLSNKLSPAVFRTLMSQMQAGDILALPWLNVNEDISGYYSEEKTIGIAPTRSLKRYKDIAFADDGFTEFAEWQYAHVNTAPFVYGRRFLSLDDSISLLHLEQVNLLNYASKKDWYRIRAYAQNGKLPVDPYTDIKLPLLQLEDSLVRFAEPVYKGDGRLIEVFLKPASLRIQSNAEGCELYPQIKDSMYLKYHLLSNEVTTNNISEK